MWPLWTLVKPLVFRSSHDPSSFQVLGLVIRLMILFIRFCGTIPLKLRVLGLVFSGLEPFLLKPNGEESSLSPHAVPGKWKHGLKAARGG